MHNRPPSLESGRFRLEAPGGFEPPDRGFAVRCLTTWLRGRCSFPQISPTWLIGSTARSLVPGILAKRCNPTLNLFAWDPELLPLIPKPIRLEPPPPPARQKVPELGVAHPLPQPASRVRVAPLEKPQGDRAAT